MDGTMYRIERHDGTPGDMTDIHRGRGTIVETLPVDEYVAAGHRFDALGFADAGWVYHPTRG
jgi:hypothetical protein